MTETYPRLLGDIGGTNARFAWAESASGPVARCVNYRCADYPTIADAISSYVSEHAPTRPQAAALGIANPIDGDQVRMTNGNWSFSIQALKRDMGVQRLSVVNDFTALALALPSLEASQLHALEGGSSVAGEPLAVLGAGTGLGVAGLLPLPHGAWRPLSGEGGHASLAGQDAFEDAVIARLRLRFGHVSAERALSGPGLVNLYQACAEIAVNASHAVHGAPDLTPPEVLLRAEQGDPLAAQAIGLFCSFLGSVAGNLALTLGARGGVYIGGGVAPRLLKELRQSNFRARFEGKGRFADYLAAIPCFVIDAAVSPALDGASRALDLGL
ncbi:glucokinase [Paucibacter sp. AS339]|uniref:glucokinase n=1 Tax=Paucibacter hankyongi TaxID=3133434 RepID=UPI0030A6699E